MSFAALAERFEDAFNNLPVKPQLKVRDVADNRFEADMLSSIRQVEEAGGELRSKYDGFINLIRDFDVKSHEPFTSEDLVSFVHVLREAQTKAIESRLRTASGMKENIELSKKLLANKQNSRFSRLIKTNNKRLIADGTRSTTKSLELEKHLASAILQCETYYSFPIKGTTRNDLDDIFENCIESYPIIIGYLGR